MIIFQDVNLKLGNKNIFIDFNLTIKDKQKIIFTAPSGSGKSTLFKILLGFVEPSSGKVFVDNDLLTSYSIRNIRKKIGYVSQDVDFRDITVNELYKEINNYKINKKNKFNKDKFLQLIEYLELDEEIIEKNISELSGGERQRLGLIFTCMLDREIFLLDEITSGLDERLKRKVIEYVIKLDKTILIISHDKIWLEYDMINKVEWSR